MFNAILEPNKFTDELIVESLGTSWKLIKTFHYYYEDGTMRLYVVVPEGFITDFASTPRWIYPLLPPVGIYNKAVILHDYLYDVSCTLDLTRAQADKFLLQALEVLGVSRLKRSLLYLGVRVGGSRYFREASSI